MKMNRKSLPLLAAVPFLFACSEEALPDKLVAKAGSEKIYQSDVDYLKRSTPKPYAEPGQGAAALENLIESRLIFQEAKKLVGADSSKVEKRMSELEDRFLARFYDEYFIAQDLGFSDAALRKFFTAEKGAFAADSCRALSECRSKVAARLYLKTNAAAFRKYSEEKLSAQSVSEAEVAYVVTSDSAAAQKAAADFRSGLVPLSAIEGLVKESFKSNAKDGLLKNAVVRESLFGENPQAVGESRVLKDGDSYFAVKVVLRRSPETFEKATQDSVLAARFVNLFLDSMNANGDSLLQKRYGFRTEPIRYPEVAAYYEAHKEEFGGAPLDSVARRIESKLSRDSELPLDSGYVLSTVEGRPLVMEKDAQNFLSEIPERYRREYPRRRRVFMLSKWKLKAMAARDAGLDRSAEFQKMKDFTRMSFFRSEFARTLSEKGFFAPEDSLRKVYGKFGPVLFPGAPFEKVVGELGIFVQTPDREFVYRYVLSGKDDATAAGLDSVKVRVFPSVAKRFSGDWFERYRRGLYKTYPVEVLDSAYLPRKDLFSPAVLAATADSFYDARNLSGAWLNWQRVHALTADGDDSLYAESILKTAQIDAERERFADAEKQYAAFVALWPDSPRAEKALFNRAFILRENLKNDSLSKRLFREFLQKYPKSGLASDAEWLLKDIESGGKLSEELDEKISQQEKASN